MKTRTLKNRIDGHEQHYRTGRSATSDADARFDRKTALPPLARARAACDAVARSINAAQTPETRGRHLESVALVIREEGEAMQVDAQCRVRVVPGFIDLDAFIDMAVYLDFDAARREPSVSLERLAGSWAAQARFFEEEADEIAQRLEAHAPSVRFDVETQTSHHIHVPDDVAAQVDVVYRQRLARHWDEMTNVPADAGVDDGYTRRLAVVDVPGPVIIDAWNAGIPEEYAVVMG